MATLLYLMLFLALSGHSSGSYCACKQGNQAALQKTLDYACGSGADCTPILQNGVCYNPNTVLDHCSYAVNSYYQKKGQAAGSCDFSGTATVTPNPPSTVSSGCVYPSSASNTGTSTSTTGTTTTGTGTSTTSTTPTVFGLPPSSIGDSNGVGTLKVVFFGSSSITLLISWLFLLRF